MNCSGEDHCRTLQLTANIREALLTPSNIERSGRRETISDSVNYTTFRHILERRKEGLEGSSSHAEKHQDINDQELVVTGHDHVVHRGKSGDCIGFLRNEQENRRNENREQ